MLYFFSFILLVTTQFQQRVDEHIISSSYLGYDVRYWVHPPQGYEDQSLPVLYVTDGKWYCNSGEIVPTSRKLIASGQVAPHIIVLVDAYDPHRSDVNRRNQQFLCNPDYVAFYREELIPAVRGQYNTSHLREDTGMLGVSFGGLNSMYFAVTASDLFGKIGIQSPAPHPCPDIYSEFQKRAKLPLDIYLSTGTVNDKARDTRRLKAILEQKGYDFKYQEVAEGHNWKNWKPLLDDVLVYFYGKGEG